MRSGRNRGHQGHRGGDNEDNIPRYPPFPPFRINCYSERFQIKKIRELLKTYLNTLKDLKIHKDSRRF